MKTKQKTVKAKLPVIPVRIDKSLDKYDNMILFPQKVEKAKEAFARLGVPDLSKKSKG